MNNELPSKIKKYINFRLSKKNKTNVNLNSNIKNENITENAKLKRFYTETFLSSTTDNINFQTDYKNDLINHKRNSFSLSSINNEETIKEDNNVLYFEISQLKKEINLYKSRLDELTNDYNKLSQEYQDNLRNNFSFEELDKEKDIEDEYIKLEEEKYNLKLNQVKNKNKLLRERNEKAKRHNEQMKKFYKLYTGEEWDNSKKKKTNNKI